MVVNITDKTIKNLKQVTTIHNAITHEISISSESQPDSNLAFISNKKLFQNDDITIENSNNG